MRSNLTRSVLAAAALAASAGLACAQGAARIDGTGAGLNAGIGASNPLDQGSGATNATPRVPGSAAANGSAAIGAGTANDTRVLGSGRRPGNIVPDSLPGTIGGQSNATVGINGTGTLDGSVPSVGNGSADVEVNGALGADVQR